MLIPHQFPPCCPPQARYLPTKGDTPPAGKRRKTDKETPICSYNPFPCVTSRRS